MNHFSYPLTVVQINIFEEPQNILPNQNPRPQTIEPAPPPPVFLTIECPPGLKARVELSFSPSNWSNQYKSWYLIWCQFYLKEEVVQDCDISYSKSFSGFAYSMISKF